MNNLTFLTKILKCFNKFNLDYDFVIQQHFVHIDICLPKNIIYMSRLSNNNFNLLKNKVFCLMFEVHFVTEKYQQYRKI